MGENLHLLSKHLPEMRARLDSILAKAPREQPPATAEPPSFVLGWWKRADPPTKRALTLVALMSVVTLLLCGVAYAMTLTAAPAPAPVVDRPATIIQALLYEAREQGQQEALEAAELEHFVDHEDELEGHVKRRRALLMQFAHDVDVLLDPLHELESPSLRARGAAPER